MIAAAALLVGLLVSGCGSSSSNPTTATRTTPTSRFDAPAAPPTPIRAPAFALRDQFGKMVRLSEYRGKAVLLTFLYVDCPDVCPLISAALRTTLDRLGTRGAHDVQVIAISVDPVGDTRAKVDRYLSVRGVLHRFEYLTGTERQLRPIWKLYDIATVPDQKLKRFVGHTGVVIGIDAGGRERTYYLSPLMPSAMIHDVRLLRTLQ